MTTHANEFNGEVIGSRIEDLDTPALLLDGPASDRNIRKMAEFFRNRPSQLRPHFKNHKCTTLAGRQLDAGSTVGLTCAKLGEAEVLTAHGFKDILIANQVIGRRKVQRLVEVARRAKVMVAVDEIAQTRAISEAARAANVTVGVLVELDCGMGRCGVPPGEPVLDLARQVTVLPGIRFEGIQSYEGHAIYLNDKDEREQITREAMKLTVQTRRMIEQKGIRVPRISGGSTSTYDITGAVEGIDEIQAGTYPTMDWRYHELRPEFEVALSLLVTVISRPKPGTAVLDLGVKGAGDEFGLPKIKGHPDASVPFLAEEHMIVHNAPRWHVGDKVQVIPSHACTTCNLYRQINVHEDGKVADVWPIEASGRLA